MLKRLFLILLISCLFGSGITLAETTDKQQSDIDSMLALARTQQMANQREWLKILLYHRAFGRVESRVDDPSYFLAPNGAHDPQAELEATIRNAFNDSTPDNSPQPFLCRYIARYQFLSRQMQAAGFNYAAPRCAVFDQWRSNISTNKATLVFAAIYLNSPASMYGHTFIRFDSAKRGTFNRLNDMTVGYSVGGASRGDPLFLFKSLLGSYPGEFTYAAFFKKMREYSDLESRDMWEYETNLDSEEIRHMQAFLWEQSFTYVNYYFFDDNCSLMLLAAFEAARPSLNMLEQSKPWYIPLDAIKVIRNQPGLITQIQFRPSQFNNTQYNFYRTERSLREDAVTLLDATQQQPVLSKYDDPQKRANLIDLTLSMLEYQRNRMHSEEEAANLSSYQLALAGERSKLSVASQFQDAPRPELSPDEGHNSFRAGIAYGSLAGNEYGLINLRASNHDELDPQSGYALGASSKMGDLYLRFNKDKIQVERFDLFGIFAPSVRTPWHDLPSIRFNVAIKRELLRDGLTSAALNLNAAGGYSFRLSENSRLFLMADGVVRAGNGNYLSAGPTIGTICATSATTRFEIEAGAQKLFSGERSGALLYHVDAAISTDLFDKQNSLRLNIGRQFQRNLDDPARDFTDTRLTYYHYF